MRAALVIAWRDYRSAFDGPLAYVLFAAFLVVSGLVFTWLLLSFSDLSSEVRALAAQDKTVLARVSLDAAVVSRMLQSLCLMLFILVPLVTMRLFADEARQGTLELLLTAPVSPATLVFGKFLGGLLLTLTPIVLTVWYPVVLAVVATPDAWPIATGYLGLLLVAAAFTSVGILASSLTDSPLLSAFLSFCALLVTVFCGIIGDGMAVNAGRVLAFLSPIRHYDALAEGVIDSSDVAYLLLFTAAMLFLTLRVVESRRWR